MNIARWASVLRDVGVILGLPIVIGLGIKFYRRQIDLLKAENKLLRETQYPRALEVIEAQRKVYELERLELMKKIGELEKYRDREHDIQQLKETAILIDSRMKSLDQQRKEIVARETLDPLLLRNIDTRDWGHTEFEKFFHNLETDSLDRARREFEGIAFSGSEEQSALSDRASQLTERQVDLLGLKTEYKKWKKRRT